jgi:diaminopimelate decarboxylase
LGVPYDSEAPSVKEYVSALAERLTDSDLELLLEPGRSIVAMAGALLTRVEYLKPNDIRQFAIVDAAMNDLLRPSLYGAWQDIEAVRPRKGEAQTWDIVGPVCETGDFLGKDRVLCLSQGDLLAVMGAGAYGFSMASNYNSRTRPAEILVTGDRAHVIGQRETLNALWEREVIPGGNMA